MKKIPYFNLAFGHIMKKEREKIKHTQMQLAISLNSSVATIHRLEAGKQEPLASTLYLVAKTLSIKPELFMNMIEHEITYLEEKNKT